MAPIKKIKDHFYYKKISNLPQAPAKPSTNLLTTIVALVPEEYMTRMDDIRSIFQKWNANVAPIKFVCFLDEDKPMEMPDDVILIRKKDVNWNEIPSKQKLASVMNNTYDVLINFDKIGRRQMEFASAAIQAEIKIGYTKGRKSNLI